MFLPSRFPRNSASEQCTYFGARRVNPNAMVADDALMQQCATADCSCKMATMLTCETSELTDPDLWPANRMTFRAPAVTVLLCYFT